MVTVKFILECFPTQPAGTCETLWRKSMHPFQKRCFNPPVPPRYQPEMTTWNCVTLQLHDKQGSQQKTKGVFPNSSAPPCSQEVGTEILEKEHVQTVAKTGTRCIVSNTVVWMEKETVAKHSWGLVFPIWAFLAPRKLLISSVQACPSLQKEGRVTRSFSPGSVRNRFRAERASSALELARDTLPGDPLLLPAFVPHLPQWSPSLSSGNCPGAHKDCWYCAWESQPWTGAPKSYVLCKCNHQLLSAPLLPLQPLWRQSTLKEITETCEGREEARVTGKKDHKQRGGDPAGLEREEWTGGKTQRRVWGSRCKQKKQV